MNFKKIKGKLSEVFAITEEKQKLLENKLRDLTEDHFFNSKLFGRQIFTVCFFESLESVEETELQVDNGNLLSETKSLVKILDEAIKKAGFDFAVKLKTVDNNRLDLYIDSFF